LRAAIVTGADHGYFPMMHALLQTLVHNRGDGDYKLFAFDFGLEPEELAAVEALGVEVLKPDWWFDAPASVRQPRNLGYAARLQIPDYAPGYDAYLWLDADISVQNGAFITDFLEAASGGALAIVEEKDPSYKIELYALKWHIGNAFRSFGLADGFRICLSPSINAGVFALRADAPHWDVWRRHYQDAVMRSHRANLDQHALMAALCLDKLPVTYLKSTHNWICARSQPLWDNDRQVFCCPTAPHDPISVLHLAGREKEGVRPIKTLDGDVKSMALTYALPADVGLQPASANI
jgi:lipopolysaccharide biosynthesis glycosyltransferase